MSDRLCNRCGLSCNIAEENLADGLSGLIDQEVSGGYNSTPGNGSGALDDMTQYKFSLCEFCLDWLFQTFKISPQVLCLIDGEVEDFRPARQRIAEDDWRQMKSLFEFDRRDKARE